MQSISPSSKYMLASPHCLHSRNARNNFCHQGAGENGLRSVTDDVCNPAKHLVG